MFWDRSNTIELTAGWNEYTWENDPLVINDTEVWILMRNDTRADIYYQQNINSDVQSLSGSDIWLSATSRPTGNTIWSYKTDAYGNINTSIVDQQKFALDVLVSLPN